MKLNSSKFPRGLIDIIIAVFGERISQQTRHSCEHQLCSSSRRLYIPLFERSIYHADFFSQKQQKEASPVLYVPLYRWVVGCGV